MTNLETKQVSTTDPLHTSPAAAWFAIFTNLVAVLLLAALHILSPEFSPSWRMISEYALGHYAWMLSLMFLCSGVSCWILAVAVHSEIRTNAGKLGLLFLFISGTGGVLAAFFDVNRPIGHGIAGLLGVIGFPIAALLLSVALGRKEVWRSNRKGLLWIANLSWISVVLLIATLAIMIVQLRAANGGHLPQHAPKSLPSGVLPLAGWADRMIVLSNWAWVFLAAYRVIRARRNVPVQMRNSVAAYIA
jgi:hypothetical protein